MIYSVRINKEPGSYPPHWQNIYSTDHATREAAEREAAEARQKGHTAEVDEEVEIIG